MFVTFGIAPKVTKKSSQKNPSAHKATAGLSAVTTSDGLSIDDRLARFSDFLPAAYSANDRTRKVDTLRGYP